MAKVLRTLRFAACPKPLLVVAIVVVHAALDAGPLTSNHMRRTHVLHPVGDQIMAFMLPLAAACKHNWPLRGLEEALDGSLQRWPEVK